MHGIWFNTRHASTRPNAQLLLADELPLLCACAVRPLTEIYDCSIGPRIARIAVNWISVSFELRHYERGTFFVFFCPSLHSFADHSRVHALTDFGCVAINAQRTLHAYIFICFECCEAISSRIYPVFDCVVHSKCVCIRPKLEVERFECVEYVWC